jgi:hypothetical protein
VYPHGLCRCASQVLFAARVACCIAARLLFHVASPHVACSTLHFASLLHRCLLPARIACLLHRCIGTSETRSPPCGATPCDAFDALCGVLHPRRGMVCCAVRHGRWMARTVRRTHAAASGVRRTLNAAGLESALYVASSCRIDARCIVASARVAFCIMHRRALAHCVDARCVSHRRVMHVASARVASVRRRRAAVPQRTVVQSVV